MISSGTFRLTGVLAFAAGWIAISLLLLLWDWDKRNSISHHAAANKKSFVMMGVLETISMSLFTVFTVGWLAPTNNLPVIFSLACIGAAIGFVAAAWVPVTGNLGKVHNFCASCATFLLVVITLLLALSHNISVFARQINLVVLIGISILLIMFATTKLAKRNQLYFQAAYILMFDIAVLSAAYIR